MSKEYKIKSNLIEGSNVAFRIETKVFHIFIKNNKVQQYPIIINNFNRLEWLQKQIDWLKSVGQNNIHIIDNCSTYPPLLAFYKKVKATVYFLDKNVGHEALWRTHIHQRLGKYYHVYTDPDVLPNNDTPKDFMFYFKSMLDKYPQYDKIGFGLQINDIPDCYSKKKEVIKWEKQFYLNPLENNIFKSKIDTTFALYKPNVRFQCWNSTLRTSGEYILRHEPWYEDTNALLEESKYYLNSVNEISSWYNATVDNNNIYNK